MLSHGGIVITIVFANYRTHEKIGNFLYKEDEILIFCNVTYELVEQFVWLHTV